MSIQMSNITPREHSKARAAAAGMGTLGMLAYYLPVTKGRYVEAAYNVVRNDTLDNIDSLNSSALSLTKKGKVNAEQRLFLSQLGLNEDILSINTKISQLKDSISDATTIKNLKQGFADSFEVCKKNVVERDAISMKAFNKIRWTNFAWGVGIGALTGYVLGLLKAKDSNSSYFE